MMKYYLDPKPEKIPEILDAIGSLKPEEAKNVMSSAIVFFGEVFRANPERNAEWIKIHPDKRVMHFVMVNALSYADTETSRKLLREYIQAHDELQKIRLPEKPMTDITLLEMTSPTILDACWGGFFASGNPKYAEAVVKCSFRETPEKVVDMTSTAAKWSVLALSKQQARVRETTIAYLKKASKDERTRFADGLTNERQMDLLGEILVPYKADSEKK